MTQRLHGVRFIGVVIALVGAVLALASGPARAASSVTWRGGYETSATSLEAVWMDAFAAGVERRTQGRIKVLRFPGGQLGGPDVQLREVQQGALDLALINTDIAGTLSPRFTVFSTPYLFPSLKAADAVLAGPVGAEYLAGFRDFGLVGLTVQAHSLRSFLSNKMVKTVADMKGLKIRTQGSETLDRMYEALGAIPVAVAPSEIVTALKTGTVTAADSVSWASWASKWYESAKYDVELNAVAGSFAVVLNQRDVQGLSPADQQAVSAAAREADRALQSKRDRAIADALSGMRAAGLTVLMPDQIEAAGFKAAILANGMPKISDSAWQKLDADTERYVESHKLK
ncbi:MAG: TRAP transporter substrate-binding protein [Vulcanimicrobiaceae bacterium]